MRCSNQLRYEATDVGSWSSISSYVPVEEMNAIDIYIYEINHFLINYGINANPGLYQFGWSSKQHCIVFFSFLSSYCLFF